MLRKVRFGTLLLSLMIGVASAYARDSKSKTEILTVTIVAYDRTKLWIPCLAGECEGSFIARRDKVEDGRSHFVRIDLKFPLGKPPKELIHRKSLWRLKLIRTEDRDESIDDFIFYPKNEYFPERKVPIWRLLPWAEGEKLPFDETIPSYYLVTGGFKAVSGKKH
jgi:hypothetical protein